MTPTARRPLAKSLGFMGAGVLATALALIGVAWFLRPEGNSSDFGVPLSGGRQLAFAYIKGMEYVIAAVLIATFVCVAIVWAPCSPSWRR